MKTIDDIIKTYDLAIVSGEGEQGVVEPYKGTRTVRALKARITRKLCGGSRWARVEYRTGRADAFGNAEWAVLFLGGQ